MSYRLIQIERAWALLHLETGSYAECDDILDKNLPRLRIEEDA
jgi:hypothetical protein